MTTIAPVSAPVPANNAAHDQQHKRAPVEYRAAVTHRDLVKELRVDPAAIAHKKRAAPDPRESERAPERRDHRGQYVDIEV